MYAYVQHSSSACNLFGFSSSLVGECPSSSHHLSSALDPSFLDMQPCFVRHCYCAVRCFHGGVLLCIHQLLTGGVLLCYCQGQVRRDPATHHVHEQQRDVGQKGKRAVYVLNAFCRYFSFISGFLVAFSAALLPRIEEGPSLTAFNSVLLSYVCPTHCVDYVVFLMFDVCPLRHGTAYASTRRISLRTRDASIFVPFPDVVLSQGAQEVPFLPCRCCCPVWHGCQKATHRTTLQCLKCVRLKAVHIYPRHPFPLPIAALAHAACSLCFTASPTPQVMDFFKLPTNAAIVLVDEVALDFGQLRLKAKGGAGGHNGLKSLQSHLKTPEYTRLRIGVGGEDSTARRGGLDGGGVQAQHFRLPLDHEHIFWHVSCPLQEPCWQRHLP